MKMKRAKADLHLVAPIDRRRLLRSMTLAQRRRYLAKEMKSILTEIGKLCDEMARRGTVVPSWKIERWRKLAIDALQKVPGEP